MQSSKKMDHSATAAATATATAMATAMAMAMATILKMKKKIVNEVRGETDFSHRS